MQTGVTHARARVKIYLQKIFTLAKEYVTQNNRCELLILVWIRRGGCGLAHTKRSSKNTDYLFSTHFLSLYIV